MARIEVSQMAFAKVYPLLVNKAERKGRTRAEVDQVTSWLTCMQRKRSACTSCTMCPP